jgi:ankyrin repeat protein
LAAFLAAGLPAAELGPSTLVDAAKSGNKDAIRALLQKKVDVNAADADGSTALQWASYHDDVASAELLLRAGAHVNAANDLGATPLWLASRNGSSAMVRTLLKAGANPNAALPSGETPVMEAARSGYPDAVEQLLAAGANPNAHGTRDQTALMWAVAQKHPAVVKVLLAHGADIKMKSAVWSEVMAVPPHGYLPYNKAIPHGGETALMFAARVGDLDSAKLLVAAGANVNDTDAWGVSATVLAAHSGFRDLAGGRLQRASRSDHAPGRTNGSGSARSRRRPQRCAEDLDPHPPVLRGLAFRALHRRRHAVLAGRPFR